jgi:hypothetical protein
VILRDYSTVHGDVVFHDYIQPSLVRQNGTQITGSVKDVLTSLPNVNSMAWPVVVPNVLLPNCVVTNDGQVHGYEGGACQSIKVESGGVLIMNGAKPYNLTTLQVDAGASVGLDMTKGPITLLVQGNVLWSGQWFNTVLSNENIAQNMYLYSAIQNQSIFIDGLPGTIAVPYGDVTVGQSKKVFYGAVIARDITVHQDTQFWYVPFTGKITTSVAQGGL